MATDILPFSFFFRRYQPANKSNADEHFTTAQVQEIIMEHSGELVSLNDVYNMLTDEGFEECGLGGPEFYWMLQEQK